MQNGDFVKRNSFEKEHKKIFVMYGRKRLTSREELHIISMFY